MLVPENDDPVLHLFTADNIVHIYRSGKGGNEGYCTFFALERLLKYHS